MQYDELKHFEKLLDEFHDDAVAAAMDNGGVPSESKRIQYYLTRRNLVAFVEGIVLDKDKFREDATGNEKDADALRKERDLLGEYLYDVVEGMSAYDLSQASDLVDLDYCQAILDKAEEFAETDV